MAGFWLHAGVSARSYFSLRFFDISPFTRAACLATRLRLSVFVFFGIMCRPPSPSVQLDTTLVLAHFSPTQAAVL